MVRREEEGREGRDRGGLDRVKSLQETRLIRLLLRPHRKTAVLC